MKSALVSLVLVIIILMGLSACAQKAKAPVKPKDPAMEQVRIQVDHYKPNIVQLFKNHANGNGMKGLISITLYLSDDGSVALSDISPVRGSLSNSFLIALENMTNQWTFKNTRKVAYSFTMNLE